MQNEPSVESIHGITLEVYASINAYMDDGVEKETLYAQAGINREQWKEIDNGWRARMEADESFVLITRYSQCYNEADKYLHIV